MRVSASSVINNAAETSVTPASEAGRKSVRSGTTVTGVWVIVGGVYTVRSGNALCSCKRDRREGAMRRFAVASLFLAVGVVWSPVASIHAQAQPPAGAGQPQAAPQQPAPRPTDAQERGALPTGTTFRSATELVALNVTVTDARQQYVSGLAKDDFAVFEDGVPQDVTFFATTNVPLDLTIMIDTSASMTDKISFVHEAARNFA